MTVVSSRKFRANMKQYLDLAAEGDEVVIIRNDQLFEIKVRET